MEPEYEKGTYSACTEHSDSPSSLRPQVSMTEASEQSSWPRFCSQGFREVANALKSPDLEDSYHSNGLDPLLRRKGVATLRKRDRNRWRINNGETTAEPTLSTSCLLTAATFRSDRWGYPLTRHSKRGYSTGKTDAGDPTILRNPYHHYIRKPLRSNSNYRLPGYCVSIAVAHYKSKRRSRRVKALTYPLQRCTTTHPSFIKAIGAESRLQRRSAFSIFTAFCIHWGTVR